MTGDPIDPVGPPSTNEQAIQQPSEGAEDEKAKDTAREAGITEDQAMQLKRSTEGDAELDSAAEAAARWS